MSTTKTNKRTNPTRASKSVETENLNMLSLTQLWSRTDQEWAEADKAAKLENAKFDMQAGLIDLDRQIAEARRAVSQAQQLESKADRELIESRKKGFCIDTELAYFRNSKINNNKVAEAQSVVEQLEEAKAYLVSLSQVLFA